MEARIFECKASRFHRGKRLVNYESYITDECNGRNGFEKLRGTFFRFLTKKKKKMVKAMMARKG
jgi:predicted DNA-binding protein (UPF0251 family)